MLFAVYAAILLAGCIFAAPYIHVRRTQFIESRNGNTFTIRLSSVSGIALCDDAIGAFDETYADASEVRLLIRNTESSAEVQSLSFPVSTLGAGTWGEVAESANPIRLDKGKCYQYSVLVDGTETSSVSLRLLGDSYPVYLFPLLIFVSTVGASLILLFLFCPMLQGISGGHNMSAGHTSTDLQRENGSRISIRRFVLVFLLCGFLNVLWMPALCVPDEEVHMANTYSLLNLLRGRPEESELIRYQTDGIRRMKSSVSPESTAAFYADFTYGNGRSENAGPTMYASPNLPKYPYLPAVAGVWITDSLHLPYQVILLSGKVTSLLFLALMAAVSMKLSPELKPALAAVCLLPGTTWLCASYSYDVWNLSMVFLFLSITQKVYRSGRVRLPDLFALILIFLLMVPVKYVYAVLGLWMLVLGRRLLKNKKLIAGFAAGGILVILAMIWIRGAEAWEIATTSLMDYRAGGAGSAYTIGYMARHPGTIILVLLHTFFRQVQTLATCMITGEFYSRYVPEVLTVILLAVFLVLLVTALPKKPSGRVRILACIVMLVGTALVNVAFLLLYSTHDEHMIGEAAGMQGRYFLPYVLMVPFACFSSRVKNSVHQLEERSGCDGQGLLLCLLACGSVAVLYCKILGFALEGGSL